MAARGSIELAVIRELVSFRVTTCLALANAASVASLLPIISVNDTLFGASSQIAGAPGFTASSTLISAGSGS